MKKIEIPRLFIYMKNGKLFSSLSYDCTGCWARQNCKDATKHCPVASGLEEKLTDVTPIPDNKIILVDLQQNDAKLAVDTISNVLQELKARTKQK